MEITSKDCATNMEAELNGLFSSIKETPSKTDNFKRIFWMCENNITDEVKIILLSTNSLNTFKHHLKTWDSEAPLKSIIDNLKFILLLAEKLPELKYRVLANSRYFTEVLRIYNSCLKYLFQRKQEEIDENCMLFLSLSYVSKYAVKFCISDRTNTMSTFGQHFFKQALSFLKYINVQFARNPNNFMYLLILTNTINTMMSKFSAYRTLFVELNGIQYCLNWLSDCGKNKHKVLQTLYYDLRILSILENFVDDPFFSTNRTAITTRVIKYLQSCGERALDSRFIQESNWVFQFACNIIIKMAMTIKGFKRDICELGVRQYFITFLNKFPNRTCAKTIYTTLLVLEDVPEIQESIEDFEVMDIFAIVDKCERLSNILLLSKMHNLFLEDIHNYSF